MNYAFTMALEIYKGKHIENFLSNKNLRLMKK